MKTKNMLVAGFSLCLLAVMSVGTMSCKKSDPVPEDVTNPLDEEVYYITGKVTEGTAALSGVSVKVSGAEASTATDGTYTLPVKKKGDYQVSFEKSGYISVSGNVTIASSAAKHSSVALSQALTKANAPVVVKKDEAVEIHSGESQEESVTTLSIPAGAVKEDVAVTVTEYVPGAQKAASTAIASLSTINCQPDGLKFDIPVEVSVKNPVENVYFENVAHYKEVNGVWQNQGPASYKPESNSYAVELTGFSNHSFGPTYTIASTGTSSEKLADVVVDNLGVMEAKEAEVVGKQKFGWQIDGDLKALIQETISGLSNEEQATLASAIESAIASSKGSNAGVTETALSLGKSKVSGDTKMTVSFTAKVVKTTGTFKLRNKSNGSIDLVVPVKTYNGVDTKITYEQGNSRPDHSGGGGN